MNTPALTRRLTALLLLASAPGVFAQPAAPSPMPVPAAVAITRPTATELALATESLQKFLAQADPATKAIVAKFPDLIGVRPPRINPAVVPFLAPNFRARHTDFVAIAKKGEIDVLFMGDSITDWWRRAGSEGVANPPMAGKTVFDKYFGAMKVANFGIAGDTTQGVLWRLQNGEGQGFKPKAIMLLIGTNNSGTGITAEIAEGVGAVVLELRKDFPDAKILLLGIFPRDFPTSGVRRTVLAVNPMIAKLHDGQHIFYLDIGAKFLDANGIIQPDIMADMQNGLPAPLHPTAKGYEIWAEAVKDKLAELMK